MLKLGMGESLPQRSYQLVTHYQMVSPENIQTDRVVLMYLRICMYTHTFIHLTVNLKRDNLKERSMKRFRGRKRKGEMM